MTEGRESDKMGGVGGCFRMFFEKREYWSCVLKAEYGFAWWVRYGRNVG